MLQVVAVENVSLVTWKVVGEVNCNAHHFTRPDKYGIFPTEVADSTALAKKRKAGHLARAVQPFKYLN